MKLSYMLGLRDFVWFDASLNKNDHLLNCILIVDTCVTNNQIDLQIIKLNTNKF